MTHQDPEWLVWARQLQAIAQTGQAYTTNPYDRERYLELQTLASRILQHQTGASKDQITHLFSFETGYATPKVDVRAAVFDKEDRLLLVRETSDKGRWTLPGGWADVNITPAHNAIKEVLEESGYKASVNKLAALWDRSTQGHSANVFSCYKLFFICDLIGGEAKTSLETSEIGWFTQASIPTDLSLSRVLPSQIKRMFQHRQNPGLATDFE
jgi:ADP-ribose pyrophosphatase YjhB (NUDIX family)